MAMNTSAYSGPMELQNLESEPLSKSYGNEDTSYDPGKHPVNHGSKRSRFSGWRGGVLVAILVVLSVLLLNVILAIIAATSWHPVDRIATAFTGDCNKAAKTTTALHLLINLLSSLLLGASNYCMQRLVSPTRKEVDACHQRNKWLDIGIPSVRNLFSISKGRTLLWLLLACSSAPLHFLYNSVVFETIAANNVDLLVVAPEFFTDKSSWKLLRGTDPPLDATTDNFISQLQNLVLDDKYLDRSLFDNITESECIKRYSASFITQGGACFAVPTAEFRTQLGLNASNTLLRADSSSGYLNLKSFDGVDATYSYCLSQIVEKRCQVQFSMTVLYTIIVINALKALLMSFVLLRLNGKDTPLVTIGDAIKSFLERPDPWTEDCCLMSSRNAHELLNNPELRTTQRYQPRNREPWFGSVSKRGWISSILLYIATIAAAGSLLGMVNHHKKASMVKGRNGFGRVNVDYLIDVSLPFSQDSIIPFVLLANVPQALISFLYVTYNGLFTTMLANREWARYAIKRAALRVSVPGPGQRSTYFLQLPYSWSIPLIVASILLHWFVSQSIFLARIAVYKDGNLVSTFQDRLSQYHNIRTNGALFSGVGYSDTGLLAAICWGSALVGSCLLVAGIFTYPHGLPLGGTNSAVISAACHMRYEMDYREEHASEKPLKWGVTIQGDLERIGHCCFSSGDVEVPRVGYLYAGQKKPKGD